MATDVWAKDLKVSPSNASFLMSLVSRVILEQRANEITAAIGAFDWEKGYCPICGEFPSIALIEEEGGKRFLHCSACGYYWRFTRVSCPYCEKETRQGMEYFYVENKNRNPLSSVTNVKNTLSPFTGRARSLRAIWMFPPSA